MVLLALIPIGLGALFNGMTAAFEGEDVPRSLLFGAAGGATAVAILTGLYLLLRLAGVDLDTSSIELTL